MRFRLIRQRVLLCQRLDFGELKMRILIIRQRVLLSQRLWILLCWD